jgi:hypothetical protein
MTEPPGYITALKLIFHNEITLSNFPKQISLSDDLVEDREQRAIRGNGAQPKMFR